MRTARRIMAWLLIAGVGSVALAVALPYAFGYKSFTVMSGSMEPAISTGDMVVEETIAPRDARVSDVVTFKDPEHEGRLVTHRLKRVRFEGGVARMVTKGDANNTVERWNVPADGSIGRVEYAVPKVGYIVHHAGSRNGRLLLLVLPALLLALLELVRIWRPERGPDAAAA